MGLSVHRNPATCMQRNYKRRTISCCWYCCWMVVLVTCVPGCCCWISALLAGGLLKIEDILPFFPDFVTIDNFKGAITDSLTRYNRQIEELKGEMDEATEIAGGRNGVGGAVW